uniref:Uncharacterized protein n=1 Tax=Anguilla anguilla TaxID=7936 RepID=A0A0E9VYP7_ANGAN
MPKHVPPPTESAKFFGGLLWPKKFSRQNPNYLLSSAGSTQRQGVLILCNQRLAFSLVVAIK